MRDYLIPAVVATVIALSVVAVTQVVRFDCVDLGFYKSCGLSTVK
jgi:hypothetical protein